jgi:hypothetical protein
MKTIFAITIIVLVLSTSSCADDDFSSDSYNALTRQQKFNKIWGKVVEERVPYGWYSKISLLKLFFTKMKPTFDYVSDSFPEGRQKLIHSVGTVGLVEFQANKDTTVNPYTGIFQGCSHVILRLSLAKEPDESKKTANQAEDNFAPGFGIKFLRDQRHSGNTVAMFGVNGQASWNFFKNEFSNHIPRAGGIALMLLEKKFSEATPYTSQMGLKDMATYDENGKDYSNNLKFPYKLIFKPTAEANALFTDYWSQNFLPQLESIPVDLPIYDVLTLASPVSDPVSIGRLVVKVKFTRSKWGDKSLFFRHGYMDDDFAFHPEWLNPKILEDPEFKESFKATYGFEHP